MKNKEIIGIDVSKDVLDCYLLSRDYYFIIENNPTGFSRLLETCCDQLDCKVGQLYLCFEDTGRYSRLLAVFLQEQGITFSMVNALDVKQSKGLVRGKSDKKDARTLAYYAQRKSQELLPTVLHEPIVGRLRQLLQLRDKLIKHRTAHKNSICDLEDCFEVGETTFIKELAQRLIKQLDQEVALLEEEIDRIFASMESWEKNYKLIQTIKGIGPVLAKYLMIYTENFTKFCCAKKFACYAGIAPFEYSSGSSVKGRTRVHRMANKHMKSMLNMSALCVIRIRGEYKQYYDRRTEEGKNKMSTLNIIRNKLVARVFAVVKRQTPYVDLAIYG